MQQFASQDPLSPQRRPPHSGITKKKRTYNHISEKKRNKKKKKESTMSLYGLRTSRENPNINHTGLVTISVKLLKQHNIAKDQFVY